MPLDKPLPWVPVLSRCRKLVTAAVSLRKHRYAPRQAQFLLAVMMWIKRYCRPSMDPDYVTPRVSTVMIQKILVVSGLDTTALEEKQPSAQRKLYWEKTSKAFWRKTQIAHGIGQARMLAWLVISPSRGSSWGLRDGTCISCIGRQFLYHCATWEPSPVSLVVPNLVLCAELGGSENQC